MLYVVFCWLRIRALALNSSPHHDLIAHRLLFYPLLGLPMIMISCVESCVDMVAVSKRWYGSYMLRSELGFSLYVKEKEAATAAQAESCEKNYGLSRFWGLNFFAGLTFSL